MPASSATEWLELAKTVIAPVVSPSAASVVSVVPSIWRSNLPGSLAGERLFRTSIVPVSRVLVIVQTMSAFSATGTLSGPEPEPEATTWPAPSRSRQVIDAV